MKSVVKKPVITEKSLKDASKGVFTFFVDLSSRKEEIKNSVEKIFGVHVKSISTIRLKGKTKTSGRRRQKIKEPDTKKALVKLAQGEKIPLFEIGQSK